MSEQTENQETTEQVAQTTADSPVSIDEGVIKVNLAELNKPQQDAVPEQEADAGNVPVEQPENKANSEEVVQEVRGPFKMKSNPFLKK